MLVRTVHPFPGARGLFCKLVRGRFPNATVGFVDSESHVCLFVKAASARDVDAYIDGILPLQAPQRRVRLALSSDVMFHVGCLRHALAALGEIRHLAIESGKASGRPLFGCKATAVVRVPYGTKIPGTLSFSMGGLTYAVKVALHPEQFPSAPRARADGHSAPGARSAPAGPTTAAAAAAPEPARLARDRARKPAGICFAQRDQGACSRTNCQFSHPTTAAGAPLQESKHVARGDGFAPAGTCFAFFNNGKCKRDPCKFKHVRAEELPNRGADAPEQAAGSVQTEQERAVQEHTVTELKAHADCTAHAAAEEKLATPVATIPDTAATNALAAPPQGTLHDPARAWGLPGPLVLGTSPVPLHTRALGPPQQCLALAAGSASRSAEPPTPKHDPLHADRPEDSDVVHRSRPRSDDEVDRDDCRHDTLEVLAVEGEQHLCARCEKKWTPSSPSVMSCVDCNGLICDPCHKRLSQNASRRATKTAQRQVRASRGRREDSPTNFLLNPLSSPSPSSIYKNSLQY